MISKGQEEKLAKSIQLKERNYTCIIESQNHRMIWVGRDLKGHLIPNCLPWAGTPSTRPDCSKPHLVWP